MIVVKSAKSCSVPVESTYLNPAKYLFSEFTKSKSVPAVGTTTPASVYAVPDVIPVAPKVVPTLLVNSVPYVLSV